MKLLNDARKAGVAVLGLVGQAVNAGLVPDKYQPLVAAVLALFTALGVYQVQNTTPGAHAEQPYNGDVA